MRRPLVGVLLLQALIIIICLEGFGMRLYYTAFEDCYDQVKTVSGTVKTVRIKDDYTAVTIDMGWENVLLRLKNVTDETYVYDLVGRTVTATGLITQPDAARNPGCFNYRNYLRARHCYALMDASTFKFSAGAVKNYPMHLLSKLKCRFLIATQEMLDEDSFGLLTGIMFGDKGYMEDSLYEEFQSNGIAHVLAVSGLHVGLVYSLVRRALKRNDVVASLISLACLFVYAALADFSVSVIRAGVMILLNIVAFHTCRRYDMLSAACAIGIVLLAINPYYIYDSGAQLSFLAAYSLAVLLPKADIKFKKYCDEKRNEKLYNVGKIFLPGLVLQVGMVPLMAYHFTNFSPLSILINPIAIYLASLLLPAGLVCLMVFPVKLLLAAGCGVCWGISKALIFLSNISDKICGGFSVPAPTITFLAVYYLLLFWLSCESRSILLRQGKDKISVGIATAMVLAGCMVPWACGLCQSPLPWVYNKYDAVFLDVGQGDSIHIQSDGVNVLVDGGGSYYTDVAKNKLQPYLLKHGITKIDLAIVTHLDSDHSKGIADLSEMMKIEKIIFPAGASSEDLSDFKCDEKIFAQTGDVIYAGDAVFTIISAGDVDSGTESGSGTGTSSGKSSSGDSNEEAIVALCSVNGTDILLMSDIPIEIENLLDFPKADILKVGHHGSKTSTSERLLQQAAPAAAVISCGKNNRYGHPHNSVLELLENSGIIIKRTDLGGAVCVKNGKFTNY